MASSSCLVCLSSIKRIDAVSPSIPPSLPPSPPSLPPSLLRSLPPFLPQSFNSSLSLRYGAVDSAIVSSTSSASRSGLWMVSADTPYFLPTYSLSKSSSGPALTVVMTTLAHNAPQSISASAENWLVCLSVCLFEQVGGPLIIATS